jgi:hypothetical protein
MLNLLRQVATADAAALQQQQQQEGGGAVMVNGTISSSPIPSNHNKYWTRTVDDLPYVLPTAWITDISLNVGGSTARRRSSSSSSNNNNNYHHDQPTMTSMNDGNYLTLGEPYKSIVRTYQG